MSVDAYSTRDAAAWLAGLEPGGPDIDDDFGPALIGALADHPDTLSFAIITDGGYDMSDQVGPIGLANEQGASIDVFAFELRGADAAAAKKVAKASGGVYVELP